MIMRSPIIRSPKTGPKTKDQSESMPTHTGQRLWDGPLELHNGLVISQTV